MVLLWQATDSHMPPFYRGKALPTAESGIKIVAMPEIKSGGAMLSSKNMSYDWKKNYTNLSGSSGYGKNFFTYVGDYLTDTNTIGVLTQTTDQRYSSEGSVQIGSYEPKIIFYERNSELGILWERALASPHQMQNGEISLVAVPYFMSPKDIRRPDLVFNWFVNNELVATPIFNKNTIPLRIEEGNSGTSRVRLEIENTYKIFQTAEKEISIQF